MTEEICIILLRFFVDFPLHTGEEKQQSELEPCC